MDASGPQTAWRVHLTCYLLLGAVFVYVILDRCRRVMIVLEEPGVEPVLVAKVESRIDPNTACWDELARLPDVGEGLARAIVAYREQQRGKAANGSGPQATVFRSIEDLDPIPGLGEKRLRQMEPFLLFPADPAMGVSVLGTQPAP